MSQQPINTDLSAQQKGGIAVFVILCGIPALEMNGFGFHLGLSLPVALACAIVGGAVGGMMFCSRPVAAGLIGGLLAGPIGLLAVYYYTQHRDKVWNLELVIVQGIGCLPGILIGIWLKRLLSPRSSESSGSDAAGG